MTSEHDNAVFESDAELLRWLPISTVSTSGTLHLEDERLSFRTSLRKRVVFDEPVEDFHSLSLMMGRGLHIWLGTKRYRLSVGSIVVTPASGADGIAGDFADGALAVASLPAAQAHDAHTKALTSQWIELLGPRVGAPPSDLKVRRPWPAWAWWLGIVGVTIVIAAVITAATLVFG